MHPQRPLVVAALGALVVALAPTSSAGAEAGAEHIDRLTAAASITRTTDGIAHIKAGNRHDLYFLQGWVHAQDRLFQMDTSRRVADGTLAELLGPGALPQDVELRTIGLHRAAQRSWDAASPRARLALSAYAEGVNAFVASHPLPAEYQALHLTTFRPWRPQDSAAIGKLIAFNLSFDLDIDLTLQYLSYVATGAKAGFNGDALFFDDLNQSLPFSNATTVPDANSTPGVAASTRSSAAAEEAAVRRLANARGLIERFRRDALRAAPLAAAMDRSEHAQGSNEWVIGGTNTESGRPILANDPHLALDQPSTFYPIHLRADGIDVAGEGFAGAPGVIIGQNKNIAWGATTNPMDVTDTYLEQVRPDASSPSGLATVHDGALEPIIAIPETFRVNQGGTLVTVPPSSDVPATTLIVPRRNNGPIVELDVTDGTGTALSVQYTGFSATQELDTFLQWDEARNLQDFRTGLQHFDFGSQNWSYVDRSGNIAYFTSGELPLREDLEAGHVTGLPPMFFRDGTGGNEWLPRQTTYPGQAVPYEILPPEEMPQTVNPANGWFVNANNDPIGTVQDGNPLNQLRPTGGIFYLSAGYDGLRAGRITEMVRGALAGGHKVDVGDIERMQSDTVFIDAEFFVPVLLKAFDAAQHSSDPTLQALAEDPRIAEAAGRLAAWDFSSPTGIPEGYDAADRDGVLGTPSTDEVANSVAATIYSTWRSRVLDDTIGRTLGQFGLSRPRSESELVALKRILSGDSQSSGLDFFSVPGVSDPATRQGIVLLRSLAAALDRLASMDFAPAFGRSTDQADYRWGLLHRLVLDSPLDGPFSVPPAFGQFPAPLSGLPGVPVDGGYGTVDAASHDAHANSVNGFMFGSGPARRYVGIAGRSGITGESALPGGTSADPTSPHYLDRLRPYLTDDYYSVRFKTSEIVQALESVTLFLPSGQ